MLRNFRKMAPFRIVNIPIPFPCVPQPLPSMLYFGPSSLSFTSANTGSGVGWGDLRRLKGMNIISE